MAAVTAAVVAAGATAYAANRQSKAAKDAANAQTGAANSANAVELQMFNQSRQDNMPWLQRGTQALDRYSMLLGLGAGSGPSAPADWFGSEDGAPSVNQSLYASDPRYKAAWDQATLEHANSHNGAGYSAGSDRGAIESRLQTLYGQQAAPAQGAATDITSILRSQPGYQFGLSEGNKQIQASAAARGGLLSGATLKALQKYGTDYADQQAYTPYMNRLASLAGIGQTAANQNAQLGQNYANSVGGNLINAGNARAQSTYARGDAQANMTGNLAGIAGMLGSYYSNRPQAPTTMPSSSFAYGFGNNTGWLGGY